ncbi:FecCD family ABC transporter permease [Alkalimarinus sediminis]|uniref:Iron ABC transporter permease n=1 Tax=Alkalimarinus sediminis TaxID=1632866 RepID=A0A9E8HQJ4_9ALTE|nr:iron ABC transporter permease [Alkalimarinus sediminis]UZW74696.1 iron ABC transporter permease [Alkalimarinus sediminis]
MSFLAKPFFILLLMLLLLTTLMATAIFQGPSTITSDHVLAILANAWGSTNTVEGLRPWMQNVLIDVRMPRILLGALAGACLAICGAVMQGMFRNPLASPSVLGVSSGASLGAVIALYLGLASVSIWALPLFAFIGAGLTLFLVYRIASQRGHTATGTLLLAGVAIGALNTAISSLILALSLNNWEVGRMIIYWTMGGLDGRTWDHVWLLLPFAMLGTGALLFFSRSLDALLLGEVHAASIGVDIVNTRRWLLVITALMVGATVSVCGSIGFIGLVVPHILRLLMGPHHRYLLPASAIGGAITLVGADLLLRTLTPEKAIPLGVATATLGAPFFLFLLVRKRWSIQV